MPVQNPPMNKTERKEYVDPNKFDLRTHETDARGRVKGTKLYRLHSKDGVQLFERPVDSGNLFYENNEEAGRVTVVKDKRGRIVGKKFDLDAKHVAFKTPMNEAEEMERKLDEANARAAAAEKELAAIRAEKEDGMGKRMVGDEVYDTPSKSDGEKVHDGVGRSAKDAPLKARLTEPKSSSTPVDPTSGHAVPVDPLAEAVRAGQQGQNADANQGKQSQASPNFAHESTGKAEAPRPGPTPAAVHAKQAVAEPARPASGPGSGPTPPNVHADRAKAEALKKQEQKL